MLIVKCTLIVVCSLNKERFRRTPTKQLLQVLGGATDMVVPLNITVSPHKNARAAPDTESYSVSYEPMHVVMSVALSTATSFPLTQLHDLLTARDLPVGEQRVRT